MKTRSRALLAVATIAALASAAALADEAARLFGKVKKVETGGGAFSLEERGATLAVTVADDAELVVVKTASLADCAKGTQLHVLGKKQPATRDPKSGATLPATIIQIVTIVAGEKFAPPPIPKDVQEKGCEWIAGPFETRGKVMGIGTEHMQVGHDRAVILIAAGKKDAIAKGAQVLVDGTRADAKAKEVRATKVTIVAPTVPEAERRVVLGI